MRVRRRAQALYIYGKEGWVDARYEEYFTLEGESEGWWWQISNFYIRAPFRRQGIGSSLLAKVIEEIQKRNKQPGPIVLYPGGYVETELAWLKRWYRKQGFLPVRGTRDHRWSYRGKKP